MFLYTWIISGALLPRLTRQLSKGSSARVPWHGFSISSIYKVDRSKCHHASRKPVGGDSIPALGFYGSANLGDEIRLPSDFSIVFTVSELSVWVHLWVRAQNNTFLSVILSWKNLCEKSVAKSSAINFPILLVPDNTKICSIVKINETGSVQNKKPQVNKRVLIDDKLNEIGFQLEQISQ